MSTATSIRARPKIKIHPLEDRVVVLPAEEAESMRGPLYIPDTAKEKPTQGEVLAVGPGKMVKGERVKMDIEVGDTVIYGKYTGVPYQVGDDELIIIKASDVLAKID
jgi:chaperonin GroES